MCLFPFKQLYVKCFIYFQVLGFIDWYLGMRRLVIRVNCDSNSSNSCSLSVFQVQYEYYLIILIIVDISVLPIDLNSFYKYIFLFKVFGLKYYLQNVNNKQVIFEQKIVEKCQQPLYCCSHILELHSQLIFCLNSDLILLMMICMYKNPQFFFYHS